MLNNFSGTVENLFNSVKDKIEQSRGTEIERKVKEATSSENWGAASTLKDEIARATYDLDGYQEVMPLLWKRIEESSRNWRIVFKGLELLEFLLRNGSERVISEARSRMFQLKSLGEFSCTDAQGREKGTGVREKSKALVNLLNDDALLREEREKAERLRGKYVGKSASTFAYENRGFGNYSDKSPQRTVSPYERDMSYKEGSPYRPQRRIVEDGEEVSVKDPVKKKKKKKKTKKKSSVELDAEKASPQVPLSIPEPQAEPADDLIDLFDDFHIETNSKPAAEADWGDFNAFEEKKPDLFDSFENLSGTQAKPEAAVDLFSFAAAPEVNQVEEKGDDDFGLFSTAPEPVQKKTDDAWASDLVNLSSLTASKEKKLPEINITPSRPLASANPSLYGFAPQPYPPQGYGEQHGIDFSAHFQMVPIDIQADKRVAAFLKPIKDLASAWEIDIANELDEYLHEIVKMNLDSAEEVNFAEAALLIQGSASLYSQKVEHLYKALFEVLNALINKRHKSEKRPTQTEGEIEVFDEEEDKLLTLDDLEEDTNIDMIESYPSLTVMSPISRKKHNLDKAPLQVMDIGPISLDNCFLHPSGALMISEEDHVLFDNAPVGTTKKLDYIQEDDGAMGDNAFEDFRVQDENRKPLENSFDVDDLWEMEDPYAEITLKDTCFKKGKTWRALEKREGILTWEQAIASIVDELVDPYAMTVMERKESLKLPLFACFDMLAEKAEAESRKDAKDALKGESVEVEGWDEDEDRQMNFEPMEELDDNVFPDDGDEIEESPIVPSKETYEDSCRRHLEEYIRNAESFAFETDISKRVDLWRKRIEPLLEEEGKHPEFDIDMYGTKVLSEIEQKPLQHSEFKSVVQGKDRYDICRLFLATLMLANHENVEIVKSGGDDFFVEFKKKNLHSESLQKGFSGAVS